MHHPWSYNDAGFRVLTLHFASQRMEDGFLQSRKGSLVRHVKIIAGLVSVGFVCLLLYRIFVLRHLERSTFDSDLRQWANQVQFVANWLILLGGVLMGAASSCQRLAAKVSPAMIEVLFVFGSILVLLLQVLCNPDMLSKMYDLPHAEYCYSDSGILLAIDGVITAAHSGMPLRWRILVLMQVVGVLLYAAVVFVIGSCEMGTGWFNLLALMCLVTASSINVHGRESRERRDFLCVIREKTLRCQAEHRLTSERAREPQLVPSARGSEAAASAAPESSIPTATPTEEIFNAINQAGADLIAQLSRIAQLGFAEHWCLKEEEVQIPPGGELGQGGFGDVVRGIFCGMTVAVKSPRESLHRESLKCLPELCNELRILRRLRHPNIVGTFGAIICPQDRKVALVLEFIDGVTLGQFMGAAAAGGDISQPSPYVRYRLLLGLCRALEYMHTRQPHIVHGDLKSTNIMVEGFGDNVHAKVLDLGLSRILTRTTRPMGGTLAWMAPEVYLGKGPVKCSADIFSLGHLIAFVAASLLPSMHVRLQPWPLGCLFAPPCRQMAEACLSVDEAARPRISEVRKQFLDMPEQLGLLDSHDHFLEDIRLLARQQVPQRVQRVHHTVGPIPEGEPLQVEVMAPAPPRAPVLPRPKKRLLKPGLAPTRSEVMISSISRLIMRWNCEVQGTPCCEFHARAQCAQRSCSVLMKNFACNSVPESECGGQCRNCGMLGFDEELGNHCEFCEPSSQSSEEQHDRLSL